EQHPLAQRAPAGGVHAAGDRDGEGALPPARSARRLAAVDDPLVAEAAHLIDDRQERLALLGQLVLDARRRLGVAAADDDPRVLERSKALGERSRADALAGVLELREAARAFREIVDEHGRPLRAEDLSAGGDRAR